MKINLNNDEQNTILNNVNDFGIRKKILHALRDEINDHRFYFSKKQRNIIITSISNKLEHLIELNQFLMDHRRLLEDHYRTILNKFTYYWKNI